jgi:Fic family protein
MDYTALDAKRGYYQKHKHLIPKVIKENYEAAFRVDYTHNSTAIEGNTLSLAETAVLLEDGISPNGKNMREVFEVVNHNKAFAYASRCIAGGKTLDESIIKSIHAILMENIMDGGVYRNVNVFIRGAKHTPPSFSVLSRQLEYFYEDMETNRGKMHPIEYAAWTHAGFVKIHPFIDGNGRTSRLIMNYQLMAAGFLPVSIPKERRTEYFESLDRHHCGEALSTFTAIIFALEDAHLDRYIAAIEQLQAANGLTSS